MPEELPLLDQPPVERRDAARNREALLRAAQELMEHRGVDCLTMDAVAKQAGVGKGTLFRRFGSREGLMAAVLDLYEYSWQQSVISGPPPLGPGAAAWDRLLAFGESRLRHNLRQSELIEAAGYPGARSTSVFSFTSLHVKILLAELGVVDNLEYLSGALIAPLELRIFQPADLDDATLSVLHTGWSDLARRIVAAEDIVS